MRLETPCEVRRTSAVSLVETAQTQAAVDLAHRLRPAGLPLYYFPALRALTAKIRDIPEDYQRLVDEHFWDLA